jgi:tagatose 1,6-diphosphate aldolase
VKPRDLSIGKRRGITSSATDQDVFSILAFDHRQSFVKMLNPDAKEPVRYQQIVDAKLDVINALAPAASAVLLDPVYAAAQAIATDVLPANTGLLVAVEKTGYSGESTARISELLPHWGVAKIKKMGADAVKLLIYYHPDGGELTEKQDQLIAQVVSQCQEQDIAFFLEAVTYSINPDQDKKSTEFAAERPALIARMVKRLNSLEPDILKIEFPIDANHNQDLTQWQDSCLLITDAAECPWTVLSAGVEYPVFEQQVAIACQAGASGFIGGRAIWKEGIPLELSKRKQWLEDVARDRMINLRSIAEEYARPWTDYYPSQESDQYQDWYGKYG